ncbi:MAG: hypothetical protein AB1552_10370 [Nitrospirota bacterium]
MAEKPTLKPSNGDEKMAAQVNEIYSKFHMVENLLADLSPALEKISKDLHPTIKDLREKYERDETVELIRKVGDNIPTFLQLFEMMKIVKGLLADMMPAVEKIADDASPVIKDMRERFEREETLALLKKVGDNIPLFLQLFDMMKIGQGMLADLMPAVEKIVDDASPVIKDMRERFEREETLALLKKVGDNIPLFLQLMSLIPVGKGLVEDMLPAVDKITHDISPTITQLREKYEREETLEMIMKLGDDIPVLIILLDLLGKQEIPGMLNKLGEQMAMFEKLVDFLDEFGKTGILDVVTKLMVSKEMNFMIRGIDKCAITALQDIRSNPVKPGIKNLITAVMDPEVQKGLLILTKFAKYLPRSLAEAQKEVG